jgi:hypothetical protein
LNCPDVTYKNFKVTGSDPHGFDRDNDGIGCDSANEDPDNNPLPPVCTPDGPPCPPCPEGVEAGWCADEDELQDFDCGDPDMENDPRCENGEPVNGSEEEEETTEEPENGNGSEEEGGGEPEGSESTGEGQTGTEPPA